MSLVAIRDMENATKERPAFTFEVLEAETDVSIPKLVVHMERSASPWIADLIERLNGFLSHEAGWDTYDGAPLTRAATVEMLTILSLLDSYSLPRPFLAPTSSGGAQLEWELEDVYAQVGVDENGGISCFVDSAEDEDQELLEPLEALRRVSTALLTPVA